MTRETQETTYLPSSARPRCHPSFDPARLRSVADVAQARFTMRAQGGASIALAGEIAMRDPVAELGGHFRRVHEAARGCGSLEVDITELHFVSSSGLRLFVDWASWIAVEPATDRYGLSFHARQSAMWQRASLPAIGSIVPGVIEVPWERGA